MVSIPNYSIEISGRPLVVDAIEKLTREINPKVVRYDPETKLETVKFARIFYKLSWTGIKGNLRRLTLVQRKIENVVGNYLKKWEYKIEVHLIESGKGI